MHKNSYVFFCFVLLASFSSIFSFSLWRSNIRDFKKLGNDLFLTTKEYELIRFSLIDSTSTLLKTSSYSKGLTIEVYHDTLYVGTDSLFFFKNNVLKLLSGRIISRYGTYLTYYFFFIDYPNILTWGENCKDIPCGQSMMHRSSDYGLTTDLEWESDFRFGGFPPDNIFSLNNKIYVRDYTTFYYSSDGGNLFSLFSLAGMSIPPGLESANFYTDGTDFFLSRDTVNIYKFNQQDSIWQPVPEINGLGGLLFVEYDDAHILFFEDRLEILDRRIPEPVVLPFPEDIYYPNTVIYEHPHVWLMANSGSIFYQRLEQRLPVYKFSKQVEERINHIPTKFEFNNEVFNVKGQNLTNQTGGDHLLTPKSSRNGK